MSIHSTPVPSVKTDKVGLPYLPTHRLFLTKFVYLYLYIRIPPPPSPTRSNRLPPAVVDLRL